MVSDSDSTMESRFGNPMLGGTHLSIRRDLRNETEKLEPIQTTKLMFVRRLEFKTEAGWKN
jgi:hypothetical protein